MKYCGSCKHDKLESEFHKNKSLVGGLHHMCKECTLRHANKYRLSKHGGEKRREYRDSLHGRAMALLNAAATRRASSLTVNDILPALERGVCEVTGLPLDFTRCDKRRHRMPFGPSIDRIDPAKDYVKGNVRVVCFAFNAARGDWGDDVLRVLVQALVKTYEVT